MFGFGILTGLTFLPLVGVAFLLTQRGEDAATLRNIRWATLLTTLATFALSLVAWTRFDATSAAFQLVEEHPWFGSGLVYKLGVDGFSMPFVPNVTALTDMAMHPRWLMSVMGRYWMNGGLLSGREMGPRGTP